MSYRSNGSYVPQDYPEFPIELAARLIRSEKPDPEDVKEFVSRMKLAYDRGASCASKMRELQNTINIQEQTIRLLSISEE